MTQSEEKKETSKTFCCSVIHTRNTNRLKHLKCNEVSAGRDKSEGQSAVKNKRGSDRQEERGRTMANVHGLSLSKGEEVSLCSLFSSPSLVTLIVCADLLTYEGGDVAYAAA